MVIQNAFLENVGIPKDLQEEVKFLEKIGIDCSEIGYLINLRSTEEMIVECD